MWWTKKTPDANLAPVRDKTPKVQIVIDKDGPVNHSSLSRVPDKRRYKVQVWHNEEWHDYDWYSYLESAEMHAKLVAQMPIQFNKHGQKIK